VRMADKQRAVGLVGSILTCRAKAGRIRTLAAVHRGIPRKFCGRRSPPAPCIVGAQTPLLGGTRRPQRMISAADRPHPSHQWLLAAAFITDMVINVKTELLPVFGAAANGEVADAAGG